MTTQETVTSNEAEQPPQPETVSVLAKARDEWLETAEGMRAEDTSTLIHSGDPDYYQRNRLSAAFFAGVNWMFRELAEAKHLHCETIEQRTNCIGELERLRAELAELRATAKKRGGASVGILDWLEEENARLRQALEEVAEGKGAFSLDSLTHAGNTIENMMSIAERALASTEP